MNVAGRRAAALDEQFGDMGLGRAMRTATYLMPEPMPEPTPEPTTRSRVP